MAVKIRLNLSLPIHQLECYGLLSKGLARNHRNERANDT
jgi:hypothetical protein